MIALRIELEVVKIKLRDLQRYLRKATKLIDMAKHAYKLILPWLGPWKHFVDWRDIEYEAEFTLSV